MAKSVNGSIRSLNGDNDEIDGDNINVVIRVRPLNGREIKNDDLSMLQFPGDGGIWVSNPAFNVGGVAQMVERSLSMREVPGSIPGASNS